MDFNRSPVNQSIQQKKDLELFLQEKSKLKNNMGMTSSQATGSARHFLFILKLIFRKDDIKLPRRWAILKKQPLQQ
ncbi:MAG: hypothetical protein WAO52_18770 [Prolixibacteraceae bacterium]